MLAERVSSHLARGPRRRVLPQCHSGVTVPPVRTLTIKVEPEQHEWLDKQAKALKQSKGGIIRDLIEQRQAGQNGSLGQTLGDLRGCLKGSKNLSTRSLKGYGRR